MSDDIVDRLKYLAKYHLSPTDDVMQEAADDIASLRAELARLREVPGDLVEATAREACRYFASHHYSPPVSDNMVDELWPTYRDMAAAILRGFLMTRAGIEKMRAAADAAEAALRAAGKWETAE